MPCCASPADCAGSGPHARRTHSACGWRTPAPTRCCSSAPSPAASCRCRHRPSSPSTRCGSSCRTAAPQAIALGRDLDDRATCRTACGIRRRRHRAHAARGPARRLCRHRRRRAGVPHLHVRHHGRAQGRAACAALRVRAAADVSGLVRHRARRPHAACRRLQLDVHARHRAHRSVGQRRHGDHLHRREGSGDVAAADRADRRDAVCRRAGRLPADLEVRATRGRRLRHAAPRADGRRSAAAGAVRGRGSGAPGARSTRRSA